MADMMGTDDPRWMLNYLQAQRLARIKRAGGSAPPVVLPEFDYLMLVGSSTTFEAFTLSPVYGREEQKARAAFTSLGYDLPIINKAVSGSMVADLDANINAYMTSLAAPAKKVAVIINIGSNDIGNTYYAAMPQATRDAMVAGITSIVNKVTAFGYTPILATVHSKKGWEALYEEWADLMYRPLVDSLTPYYDAGSLAVFDYCRLYTINKDVPDWWRSDLIHPGLAIGPMQQYTAQGMAAKTKMPAKPVKQKVLVYFTNPSLPDYQIGGMNVMLAGASRSLTEIYDRNGVLISGASFAWSGADAGSNGVRSIVGSWDVDLGHNQIQKSSLYAGSKTITFTAGFGIAYAGRTGTLRVTGNSSAAGRLTLVAAGASSAVLNQSAAGVQVIELPFTLDASGTLVFTAAPQAPSTFANVSGVELVFT